MNGGVHPPSGAIFRASRKTRAATRVGGHAGVLPAAPAARVPIYFKFYFRRNLWSSVVLKYGIS